MKILELPVEQDVEQTNGFIIRSFRAIDDYEASKRFWDGHTKVLTDYGITNLNTAEPSWLFDESVYVVLAEDSEGQAVGGLRVHIYNGSNTIPLIDALIDLDPQVTAVLNKRVEEGTAEVCGLWNSRKVFGKGISPLLCICSVVVVKRLRLKSFFCFSAPYTEKMIKTNGCIDVEELGNKGRFNYPTEKFISIVLTNPDVNKLEFADPFNKLRIKSLTDNPKQEFKEKGPRGELSVKYILEVN